MITPKRRQELALTGMVAASLMATRRGRQPGAPLAPPPPLTVVVGRGSWSSTATDVVVVDGARRGRRGRRGGRRRERRRRRRGRRRRASTSVGRGVVGGIVATVRSAVPSLAGGAQADEVAVAVEDRRPLVDVEGGELVHRHDLWRLAVDEHGVGRCRRRRRQVVAALGVRAARRRSGPTSVSVADDLDVDDVAGRQAGRQDAGRGRRRRRVVVTAQPSSPIGVTIGSAGRSRAANVTVARAVVAPVARRVGRAVGGHREHQQADERQAQRGRRHDEDAARGRRRLVLGRAELGGMAPRTLVRRQRRVRSTAPQRSDATGRAEVALSSLSSECCGRPSVWRAPVGS